VDLPDNSEWDRTLTDYLYGGDQHYRLCQEVILGIGGVRVLRSLGYNRIERFHMNEGHASLLTLELLDEEASRAGRKTITHSDIDVVKVKCTFTTHTPDRARFIDVMLHCIALNGSFFNTHRMVQQYVLNAYFL
jgi:starch phosphorylase